MKIGTRKSYTTLCILPLYNVMSSCVSSFLQKRSTKPSNKKSKVFPVMQMSVLESNHDRLFFKKNPHMSLWSALNLSVLVIAILILDVICVLNRAEYKLITNRIGNYKMVRGPSQNYEIPLGKTTKGGGYKFSNNLFTNLHFCFAVLVQSKKLLVTFFALNRRS